MAAKKSKSEKATDTGSSKSAQIFDVARPGTLPPAGATSRPVIVPNRVVMQDPMMVSGIAPDLANFEAATTHPKHPSKIIIKPLSDRDIDQVSDQNQEDAETGEPSSKVAAQMDTDADGLVDVSRHDDNDDSAKTDVASEAAGSESTTNSTTDVTDKSTASNTPGSSDSNTQDEAADGDADELPQTKSDKEAAQLEADAKAQDELDTLVEQKTYFLPINAVEQRRSKHVLVFGVVLILILAAAWLNVAMDAGFVSIPGVQPLTHLFRN